MAKKQGMITLYPVEKAAATEEEEVGDFVLFVSSRFPGYWPH